MKRLSNKKYAIETLFWVLVTAFIAFAVTFTFLNIAYGAEVPKNQPYCEAWNTLGDEPGSVLTPRQRLMVHMGFFLTKQDELRTVLAEKIEDPKVIEAVVSCYEQNVVFLVEGVDDVCHCSTADKKEEAAIVMTNYVNDCIREVQVTKPD